MKVLTPCHPTGTKRVCFSSHLHHCNSPNTTILHVPFLTASQTTGTGMEETSKAATLFEILCWELFKTRQNKACLCGSMEHVCLYKSVHAPSATGTLLSTPWAQDALTCGFGTCSQLFFSEKNFSLLWMYSLLCQVEMAGKVMAVLICHLRLHLWRIMLQRLGKHHHINPVAEGVRTQGPVCSHQRQ